MGEAIYYLKAHFPDEITWELEQQLTAFVKDSPVAKLHQRRIAPAQHHL